MDSGGFRYGSIWASIRFRIGFDKASNDFRCGKSGGLRQGFGLLHQGFVLASTMIWERSKKDSVCGLGMWIRVGFDCELNTLLAQKVGAMPN